MLISQISVYLENVKGALRALTKTLAGADIDLLALSVADTASFGIIRLVVRGGDIDKTCKTLQNVGYMVKKNHVACVMVPNHPGGLDAVLAAIEEKNLSIEYMYSFCYTMEGNTLLILRLSDGEKNKKQAEFENILADTDIRLVSQEEINAL